jgi:hypothetical protein
MSNLFIILYDALINKFYIFFDKEMKSNFMLLNKKSYSIRVKNVKILRLFAYREYLKKNNQHNILINILKSYSNITELILGPKNGAHNNEEFGPDNEMELNLLIQYLLTTKLNHIKKITIREIKESFFYKSNNFNAKTINAKLMELLGHNNLESITISSVCNGSILTGYEVQNILDTSINLKKFEINTFQSHQNINVSFEKQTQLVSAIFKYFNGPYETIESLKFCCKLEILIITNLNYIVIKQITNLLLKSKWWNLKILQIPSMVLNSDIELDIFTKNYNQLKHLSIKFGNISDDGFAILGKNCQNLRILEFNCTFITDEGIKNMTNNIPHLESLTFDQGYNITNKGVSYIAKNCPKLKVLNMVHIKGIDIEALKTYCEEMVVFSIKYSHNITINDIRYVLKHFPKLIYSDFSGFPYEKDLIKEFPNIKFYIPLAFNVYDFIDKNI